MAKLSYSQAIRETIAQEMRRDERVFVMGEDVEKLGGVYGCTRDLYKEFGTDRVRNTPISESAIIGAALGAASCTASACGAARIGGSCRGTPYIITGQLGHGLDAYQAV